MRRLLLYLWAVPATLIGLAFVPLAWVSGGKVRVVDGVIEISGGLVSQLLQRMTFVISRISAMTLGHVVLGLDQNSLDLCRKHERIHVRQYERWGSLMIPLYLLSSAAARIRGRHPYWDNRFEREAYALEGAEGSKPPMKADEDERRRA
jgi:hypothetical protein